MKCTNYGKLALAELRNALSAYNGKYMWKNREDMPCVGYQEDLNFIPSNYLVNLIEILPNSDIKIIISGLWCGFGTIIMSENKSLPIKFDEIADIIHHIPSTEKVNNVSLAK